MSILEKENARKALELTDPSGRLLPNIESVPINRSETKAVFLWNWDLYTKIGVLKLKDTLEMDSAYVFDPLEKISYLTPDGKKLWTQKDLEQLPVYVKLPPHTRTLLVFSKTPWKKYPLQEKTPEALLGDFKKEIENEKAKKQKSASSASSRAFNVDPENCFTINIRPYCNRSFLDRVPGDGLGGWTDQGKNKSLSGLKPGRHVWLNVPFDIIRYDQNNDTSCIFMKSKSLNFGSESVNIPINRKLKNLFLLHASAWTKPGNIVKYKINYADGSSKELMANCDNRNPEKSKIGDWWKPKDLNKNTKAAWINKDKHGLYVYRWKNQNPEKLIKSLEIISLNKTSVPIIVGITAEKAE
jgi:hypothetical protein